MSCIIRYNSLFGSPVLYIRSHPDNLSGKLMAADRAKFIRTIIHFVMLHICPADSSCLYFQDDIIIAAFRLRYVNHPVGPKIAGTAKLCQCFHHSPS